PLGNVNQMTKNIAKPAVPEIVSFPPGTFLLRSKRASPEIIQDATPADSALRILSIKRWPEFKSLPLLMLYIKKPTNTTAKKTPTQNCCCCISIQSATWSGLPMIDQFRQRRQFFQK